MTDWKQELANEAEKAMQHPIFESVKAEFADNLKNNPNIAKEAFDHGLFRYGFTKCVHYAVQIARAQALDLDPDFLRLSPEQATEAQLARMALFQETGKPVIVVVDDEERSEI